MKAQFLTELDIRDIDDSMGVLLADLIYASEILNDTICVPAGFETDFASVPRVPIAYTAFGDRAHRESVIHDWLYFNGEVSRATADKVFLEAMKARGKKLWIRTAMYWGVRMGGWAAWNAHRKAGHPNNKPRGGKNG